MGSGQKCCPMSGSMPPPNFPWLRSQRRSSPGMFHPDFKELLSIFENRKVKYLLIGGYAVSLHSQPRTTKDLDILVSSDPRNAKALYDALLEFGAPLQELQPRDFAKPTLFFRMGRAPLVVDVLAEIPGVKFGKAWKKRIEVEIDPDSGLKASVISRDDLIATKLASARSQDLADVAALRHGEDSIAKAKRKGAK